jgi:hypothetical protein
VLRGLVATGFTGDVIAEVGTRRAADRAAREVDLRETLEFARMHLGARDG